jgi:hypothetical protein
VKALAAELLTSGRIGERRARQLIAAALTRSAAGKRRGTHVAQFEIVRAVRLVALRSA